MPRRFQFSLKALMAAVVVCATVAGRVSSRLQQKTRERTVIAKLEGKGARAVYDWQLANPTAKAPPGAKLIGRALSDLFFADVAAVDANKSNIGDSELALLRGFPKLELLYLYDTKVTDDGIAHLRALTTLKELNLFGTGIRRRAVEELEKALPACEITWPNPEEKASQIMPITR